MTVGLLTVSTRLWRDFFDRNLPRLAADGIRVSILVLDANRAPRRRYLRHRLRRARVQARLEACSVPAALVRRTVYQLASRGRLRRRRPAPPVLPAQIDLVRVDTANSRAAVDAFRRAGCDLVCMSNVRILTLRTLSALAVPVVNVHLSDPAFIRGAHPVLWEVLDGRDEIVVTAHVATETVDAGGILAQRAVPIVFAGGLAATRAATLERASAAVGDVFEEAIRLYRAGASCGRTFTPGRLSAAPSLGALLRAERICRARTRERRAFQSD